MKAYLCMAFLNILSIFASVSIDRLLASIAVLNASSALELAAAAAALAAAASAAAALICDCRLSTSPVEAQPDNPIKAPVAAAIVNNWN